MCVCTTYTTVQRIDVQMVHIFIVDICDVCVYINTDVKPPSSLRRSNEVGEAENEERASLKVVEREMQRETHTHTHVYPRMLRRIIYADGSSHWVTPDWPKLILNRFPFSSSSSFSFPSFIG